MRVSAAIERWPLHEPFTIARGSKHEAVTVLVRVEDGAHVGRGESLPYPRYGETPEGVVAQIDAVADAMTDRHSLRALLPAGAARNALDLALWDLEAKRTHTPVWKLAGLREPHPIVTAFTIPIRDVAITREIARLQAHRPLLKIKLGGADDLSRIEAVRQEAPTARLIVDANEGWDRALLDALAKPLAELSVELIEQPLPAADDARLDGYSGLVPL